MFRMSCPHCGATVNILSAAWQSQRQANEKTCPSCGAGVEAAFSAKKYIPAATALLLVSLVTMKIVGIPVTYLGQAIGLSLGLALLPSMGLRKVTRR